MKSFLKSFNVFGYCRELGVPLWTCPQFLFLLMGVVVIGVIVATRAIATRYTDPEIAVLIVLALSAFLLIIAYVIVHAFESVVDARINERAASAELLRLKDQFVFVAAHELRAPASAIQWALELFDKHKEGLGEDERESLRIISVSSSRLLQLVNDLLDVARVESKTITVKKEALSLSEIAGRSLAEVEPLRSEKNITIENSIPEDFPKVAGDNSRLGEVFDNLISNAVKYTPNDGTVRLSAKSEGGDKVVVEITDTGMGITKEEMEHLFEKFWRSKNAHNVEGTGLGLFIVKHLLKLMGGSIWCTSEPGKGTTFSFTLVPVKGQS